MHRVDAKFSDNKSGDKTEDAIGMVNLRVFLEKLVLNLMLMAPLQMGNPKTMVASQRPA